MFRFAHAQRRCARESDHQDQNCGWRVGIRHLAVGARTYLIGRVNRILKAATDFWSESDDKLSLGMLITMNLIPLGGVIFAGWEVGFILLVYWAENVVIGVYNIAKMAMAQGGTGKFNPACIPLIPFFLVHYGMFCFVHGIFVLVLGQGGMSGPGGDPLNALIGSFSGELLIPLLGLAASHGVSFFQNYVGKGEYRERTAPGQMAAPYGRIVILHVVLLFGGFVVMLLKSPWPLLALLVLIKIVVDLGLHAFSHRGKKFLESWAKRKK